MTSNLIFANVVAQGKLFQFFKSGEYQDAVKIMYTLNNIASNIISKDDIENSISIVQKMKHDLKVVDMFAGIIPALRVYSKKIQNIADKMYVESLVQSIALYNA